MDAINDETCWGATNYRIVEAVRVLLIGQGGTDPPACYRSVRAEGSSGVRIVRVLRIVGCCRLPGVPIVGVADRQV
jgi:hypothetical protein